MRPRAGSGMGRRLLLLADFFTLWVVFGFGGDFLASRYYMGTSVGFQ